jgi:SAM-dependent methyltransferase
MSSTEPSIQNLPYTHGYYRELSPTMIAAALESKGVTPPDLAAPLNYCELGFGFGVSLLANAACFPHMRFFGNDFNPEHVAYARRLADEAGLTNVEVFEDGFDELLQRDLPQMDFITMHGVYSWVSPAQRQVILDFIEKRLKPGGVVYVSHNTLPGWAAQMPLRQLIHRHMIRAGVDGNPADHLTDALSLMNELQALGARYFEACPSASARLAELGEADPRYAVHEYFNPYWQPQYVYEVADQMGSAGLSRAASVLLEEHVDAAWMDEPARARLAAEPDPVWRETLRDVLVNQAFRRDLYTRDAVVLTSAEREQRLLDRRWALAKARAEIIDPPLGGRAARVADDALVTALLDALSAGAASVRNLQERGAFEGRPARQLLDALMMLSGAGLVQPALTQQLTEAARPSVERFNAAGIARKGADGLLHLVCATTGQAVGFTVPALIQIGAYRSLTDACPEALARAMKPELGGSDEERQASAERFLNRRVPALTLLRLW